MRFLARAMGADYRNRRLVDERFQAIARGRVDFYSKCHRRPSVQKYEQREPAPVPLGLIPICDQIARPGGCAAKALVTAVNELLG